MMKCQAEVKYHSHSHLTRFCASSRGLREARSDVFTLKSLNQAQQKIQPFPPQDIPLEAIILSTMDLLLSGNSHLDCTYSHNSVPIYSTSTVRLKFFRRVTNITKSAPDATLSSQKSPRPASTSQPAVQKQSSSGQQNPIAQIHWNLLKSNKLVLRGKELKAKWNGAASKSRATGKYVVIICMCHIFDAHYVFFK